MENAVYFKTKRNQSENKVKCHENCGYIATGGGGGGLAGKAMQAMSAHTPLISLESLPQNSSFIFRPFHNSKFTCIGLFAAVLIHLVYVLQVAAVSKCWQGSALTSDTYSLIFPEISPASCTCSTVPAKSLLASSVSKPRPS